LPEALPETIKEKEFLFVSYDGKGVPFFVESWDADSALLHLDQVNSEHAAKALEDHDILIPAADEQAQAKLTLVGCKVYDETLGFIGSIIRVEAYPGQTMLIVWAEHGEVLIPKGLVRSQKLREQRVEVQLPEGFLDI
jgi:ribosomal 30S subunit maturation factor RimM